MGYYIRKVSRKKSGPTWKLQFISCKKEHAKNLAVKCPKRTWDIPKHRWISLGFSESMNYESARIRQQQLNMQLHLKRNEEVLLKFEETLKRSHHEQAAYIPEVYREEFEERYFYSRRRENVIKNRHLSHWRAAQQLILHLKLEPMHWRDHCESIYDWFFSKKYSISYARNILRVFNLWGYFIAKKLGTPFLSVPPPRGFERTRILESYFSKSEKCKSSDPLTPSMLESARNVLIPEQYNWLYLSIWLGLRPKEIDQLRDPGFRRVLYNETGIPILWIYQSKLCSVPERYRWKLIPLFLEQQQSTIAIIESGNFKRPLVKTVKAHIHPDLNLYGGRKGFTDLMLSKGQLLENISQWMGHSTVQRTWSNYKSRLFVHYDEAQSEKKRRA